MTDQDKNLVSMAQQFSGLPMKSLIGAPLIAAADANNMMAMTQTRFLLNTCFESHGEGEEIKYKPIMINMTLTRQVLNKNGEENGSVESSFNIPLMTVIPLNSLAVDDISVNFEMEVVSSFSKKNSKEDESSTAKKNTLDKKISDDKEAVELTGAVSAGSKQSSTDSSNYTKSNSAKYEIKAHAGKIPLPSGVITILDAFSKSIAPIKNS